MENGVYKITAELDRILAAPILEDAPMLGCYEWKNWDQLSQQDKENFLTDLIAETADEFGIPVPNVEFGDAGDGAFGRYDSDTNTITIDPTTKNEAGDAQFDDQWEAAATAAHETAHAAQYNYYYDYELSWGSDLEDEIQQEAEDVAFDQVLDFDDSCNPPPYPGDGGGGPGDGDGDGSPDETQVYIGEGEIIRRVP